MTTNHKVMMTTPISDRFNRKQLVSYKLVTWNNLLTSVVYQTI